MGKFGKKNIIDMNPLNFQICLCGLGGIGKTTLAKEVCEKLVGDEGYIHFNIGREGGTDAINNIVSEPIEDWAKLKEVVDDIIENKDSDYPKLKVIIWDSLDELIRLGEVETIRLENRNSDRRVDSILQCKGGFGRGQDFCINMILDEMWKLKNVGVKSFIIAHTKRSDIIDPISQNTYSQLTADAQQRYFNAVRNKMDIIAVGYIDREIVKEKTGRKNVATKQDVVVNKVTSESRVISFRDDSYSIDSKSRFANIVDKIPFDSDEFINAIKDAIEAEYSNSGISKAEAKKKQTAKDKKEAEAATSYSKAAKENKADPEQNEELIKTIKMNLSSSSDEVKTEVKAIMVENNIENFKGDLSEYPTKILEKIVSLLS